MSEVRLIDANALKKLFAYKTYARFTADMGQGGFEMFSEKEIEQIIDNAPTIKTFTLPDIEEQYRKGLEKGLSEWETERPKGEWINREAVSNTIFPFWERYECNQCHKFNGYSNFCPNCGADMQKGGAENG